MSIGDLDGDGALDLVFASGGHTAAIDYLLLNDGRGAFPVMRPLGDARDRSFSAALADLDGDGSLDIVIGNQDPDPKVSYLNDGKGHFHPGSTYGRPEWPGRAAGLADLNGDGRPDIIVANKSGGAGGPNYVCLNRGNGRFDADCLPFSQESTLAITAADFNGDGVVDLAVPHHGDGGQSYAYLNDGHAAFPRRVPFGPQDGTIRMIRAADLDGDGLVDSVAIGEQLGVAVFFNQKSGGFSEGISVGDRKAVPWSLDVGDMNRDGKIDLVIGYVEVSSVVFFNDGSGRRYTGVPFGDGKGIPMGLAIGDLDKNGWPDIVVARQNAPNVVYFSDNLSSASGGLTSEWSRRLTDAGAPRLIRSR